MNEPLHIGLDIDGVLADYMSAIAAVGRSMGLPMDGADRGPTRYGLVEPGWFPDEETAAEAMSLLRADGGYLDLAVNDAGAAAAVRRMRAAGHRVSIVTARSPHSKWAPGFIDHSPCGQTLTWLQQHGFAADAVLFERDKSVIGADVYLDDAPHNVTELREAGRHAVVYDATYNRHVGGLRVATVSEFVDMVLADEFHPRAA